MSRNNKGRDRWHGDATQRTTQHTPDYTEADPLAGWFRLAKSSRANSKKQRAWKGGRK